MEEIIASGYCRKTDGNRILCVEVEDGGFETDCLYPDCEFASSCVVIKEAKIKLDV